MSIVSVRLPVDLLSEVDRYTEKLQAEVPLLQVNRTDAIRYLIKLGLQQKAPRGRRGR